MQTYPLGNSLLVSPENLIPHHKFRARMWDVAAYATVVAFTVLAITGLYFACFFNPDYIPLVFTAVGITLSSFTSTVYQFFKSRADAHWSIVNFETRALEKMQTLPNSDRELKDLHISFGATALSDEQNSIPSIAAYEARQKAKDPSSEPTPIDHTNFRPLYARCQVVEDDLAKKVAQYANIFFSPPRKKETRGDGPLNYAELLQEPQKHYKEITERNKYRVQLDYDILDLTMQKCFYAYVLSNPLHHGKIGLLGTFDSQITPIPSRLANERYALAPVFHFHNGNVIDQKSLDRKALIHNQILQYLRANNSPFSNEIMSKEIVPQSLPSIPENLVASFTETLENELNKLGLQSIEQQGSLSQERKDQEQNAFNILLARMLYTKAAVNLASFQISQPLQRDLAANDPLLNELRLFAQYHAEKYLTPTSSGKVPEHFDKLSKDDLNLIEAKLTALAPARKSLSSASQSSSSSQRLAPEQLEQLRNALLEDPEFLALAIDIIKKQLV